VGVLGNFENVVTALYFFLLPALVGCHLLREVAVLAILELDLAFVFH